MVLRLGIFGLEVDDFIKDAIVIVLLYMLPPLLLWGVAGSVFGWGKALDRLRGKQPLRK